MPINGKGAAFENALLLLIFNNTAIANIGNSGGLQPSSVAGSLYAGLSTADPTSAGDQTSSEITYTSYARVAIARSSGGFTVTSSSVSPAANVNFPLGTGGAGTATFFTLGVASSGASMMLYGGAVSPSVVCGLGVTPQLTTALAVTES